MSSIVVILGHPSGNKSLNGALAQAYVQGARSAGAGTSTVNLVELEFDPILRHPEQRLEPDLARARGLIDGARHVVWVFPTWWVAPPALVKGFVDRVFTPGWAYRYQRGKALPEPLLKGRSTRLITTMDSPSFWYRWWQGRALHHAFIRGTLRFCGLAPASATTIYQARTLSAARRERWLEKVRDRGARDARTLQRELAAGGRAALT